MVATVAVDAGRGRTGEGGTSQVHENTGRCRGRVAVGFHPDDTSPYRMLEL